MRKLILLSVVLIVAACSDSQQPTAPASSRSASHARSVAGDVAVARGNSNPHGDLVGFTTIDFLESDYTEVPAGTGGGASVLCPDGAVSSGGGFEIAALAGTMPAIRLSLRQTIGTNTGWVVDMDNSQAGAGQARIKAFVLCAS